MTSHTSPFGLRYRKPLECASSVPDTFLPRPPKVGRMLRSPSRKTRPCDTLSFSCVTRFSRSVFSFSLSSTCLRSVLTCCTTCAAWRPSVERKVASRTKVRSGYFCAGRYDEPKALPGTLKWKCTYAPAPSLCTEMFLTVEMWKGTSSPRIGSSTASLRWSTCSSSSILAGMSATRRYATLSALLSLAVAAFSFCSLALLRRAYVSWFFWSNRLSCVLWRAPSPVSPCARSCVSRMALLPPATTSLSASASSLISYATSPHSLPALSVITSASPSCLISTVSATIRP
mmetsp:Transcript_22919/g.70814  ORF Transcript_22919/g.70814 Transcript_22919/m.70814 type:complete len:287 (+) Transcript_22919:1083-1943(+)